jgi:RNA polymerase sigma-70 factor (ECF subfamily)
MLGETLEAPMPGEPADSLAHDLRTTNPAAADRVDREFRDRLRRLADALLDGRVRGRLDPDDVVQSVFKSFYRRQADDPYPVADRFELWRLLATIARRKCLRAAQRHLGPTADARRDAPPAADESAAAWPADPSAVPPEAEAVMADLWRRLRGELDDAHRAVCDLRFEGHELAEIAERLRVSSRTVERRLGRVRERLEKLVAE